MKKIITLALTLLAIQGSAFAALPPLYQSLTELKTIINDERLGQYLQSGDLITDIRKVNDGYLIETNRGQLLQRSFTNLIICLDQLASKSNSNKQMATQFRSKKITYYFCLEFFS